MVTHSDLSSTFSWVVADVTSNQTLKLDPAEVITLISSSSEKSRALMYLLIVPALIS